MSGNDLFFAGLQGVVEIVSQDDAARNELAIAERGVSSGDRFTSTRRAPISSAARLI
jgi:hypothetical protein